MGNPKTQVEIHHVISYHVLYLPTLSMNDEETARIELNLMMVRPPWKVNYLFQLKKKETGSEKLPVHRSGRVVGPAKFNLLP